MVTFLKLLNNFIDETAGKIISADISSEPTRFMASTIITAVMTAMNKLYRSVRIPALIRNDSSKVIAKILL